MKGACHFGIKVNLAPRYVGSYHILEKYGPLVYQVELPLGLSGVHCVFHIYQLKRCLKPPTDVVFEDTIPLEPDLIYKCYPIKILGQQDQTTRRKTIRFYNVQWDGHLEDEAMWEREDFLRSNYPEFLPLRLNSSLTPQCSFNKSQDEISFKGRAVTPHVTKPLTTIIRFLTRH
jgi:hypothetical protein